MMGKTHIAGALASWALVYPMLAKTSLSTPQDALVLTVSLGGTILAGLLPDVDQPGSMIDQTLFGPLGKTRIGAMLGGLLLLGISFFLRSPVLMARVFHSLILLRTLIHYAPWISLILGALGACLVIIAILKHRGITHKLLFIGPFLWGVNALLEFLPILAPWRMSLLLVFGAGYLSHLLLDLIADGVPLLDPIIEGNLRLPLPIHTGSFWDVVVIRYGLLAYFAFAVANSYLPAAWSHYLHI